MKATEEQKAKMREYWAATRDVRAAVKKAYYLANRERIIAHECARSKTPHGRLVRKQYYEKTIARRRELDRARYRRHKTKRLEATKDYQRRNHAVLKIKKAARFKATYPERKALLKEKNRQDRRKHRAKRNCAQRIWQRANRDKRREYEHRYIAKNPHVRTAKNHRRRARVIGAATDRGAEVFIAFVRSQKLIPCYYCGRKINGRDAHIDHVQAISKSGNHTSSNLCASCEFCNCSKCDRTLTEWVPPTNQPMLNI